MRSLLAIAAITLFFGCKDNLSKDKSGENNSVKTEGAGERANSNDNSGDKISTNPPANTFAYNPTAGEYKASTKALSVSDVENLMKNELEIMRNEIFARHGFLFKKKELKDYFEDQDWYVGVSTDIKKDLTPLEKKNIALIMRFENYADEHGDDFGR